MGRSSGNNTCHYEGKTKENILSGAHSAVIGTSLGKQIGYAFMPPSQYQQRLRTGSSEARIYPAGWYRAQGLASCPMMER